MADDDSPVYRAIMESQGVPAGSSRSPVEEALAVLDAWATSYDFVHENDVHLRFPHAALATVRGEIERLRTYINTDGLVVSTEQAKAAVDKIDAFLAGVGGRGAADLALVTVRRVLLEQERENERLREERDAASREADYQVRQANEILVRALAAEAELERLRRHPDAWSQRAFDQQKQRAEAAEAELARTREGLREIASHPISNEYGDEDPNAYEMRTLARALLAASPPDGGGA